MNKVKMILPMMAFAIAIVTAFAGNVRSSAMLEDVSKYQPASECITCSSGETGCQTASTATICKCTATTAGLNSSCQALYKP